MGNSTISLQDVIDEAYTLGDISPTLSTGGFATTPAIGIANDVMQMMINGGPAGQPYNWKWNRLLVKPFATISDQQDYFVPGVVTLAWMESAYATNINQVAIPKQKYQLEVRKDLDVTENESGYPGRICWLPNDQLQTGTWGAFPLGPSGSYQTGFGQDFGNNFGVGSEPVSNYPGEYQLGPNAGGLKNPGPGVVYVNPIGVLQAPDNPTTCITDPNGNLWALTQFGTCGLTQPQWPKTVTYPTTQNPTQAATMVVDGTCVWTAINPKGQGFRLNPVPGSSSTVWQIQVIAQNKAPRFANVQQTLEPLPDDCDIYFKQGFYAECYRRSTDPRVRAKYTMERQLWLESLDRAVRQADRELDDYGFVPERPIMDQNSYYFGNRPDYPF